MSSKSRKKPSKDKSKKKLSKLIALENDGGSESEHELGYYIRDRVKLMKEVLKIMKPKKITMMAPDCLKNVEMEELNSMLLEELLGISNKRLKYIFDGKVLDEDSSTDEDQPIDIISLDEISDDEFVVISDDNDDTKNKPKHKRRRIKDEPKVKKEKRDKIAEKERIVEKLGRKETVSQKEKETLGEENLMSVLELLELQARARAIKSQLELESKRKEEEQQKLAQQKEQQQKDGDEEDEVIIEVVKDEEIVITSSDSETEQEAGTAVAESAAAKDVSTRSLVDKIVEGTEKEDGEVSDTETNRITKNPDSPVINLSSPKENVTSTDTLSEDPSTLEAPNTEATSTTTVKAPTTTVEEAPSKIDAAVEEFLKSQPVEPETSNEQERELEVQKAQQTKEKRLKTIKSKLESFKQDVAVEHSVNVLENIVIKAKSVEPTDDLVINIDQDDLDCIICD